MPQYKCWIEETVVHKMLVEAPDEITAETIIKDFVDNQETNPQILSHELDRLGSLGEDFVVDLVEENN